MMVISLAERYGTGQDRGRNLVLLLFDEALPEGLIRSHAVRTAAERLLEFRHGLVHEAHFLVRDSQVVVALVILVVDVFRDALLEPLEHLLEIGLLIPSGRFLLSHHPRGLRTFAGSEPVTKVDELAVGR